MAVQNQVFVVGVGKTFPATKPIPTKEYMAVWVLDPLITDPSLA